MSTIYHDIETAGIKRDSNGFEFITTLKYQGKDYLKNSDIFEITLLKKGNKLYLGSKVSAIKTSNATFFINSFAPFMSFHRFFFKKKRDHLFLQSFGSVDRFWEFKRVNDNIYIRNVYVKNPRKKLTKDNFYPNDPNDFQLLISEFKLKLLSGIS